MPRTTGKRDVEASKSNSTAHSPVKHHEPESTQREHQCCHQHRHKALHWSLLTLLSLQRVPSPTATTENGGEMFDPTACLLV